VCSTRVVGMRPANAVSHVHGALLAKQATHASRPVDFVEADILLDKASGKPVMAHPPATSSDLTFEAFVQRFVDLALKAQEGSSARPLGMKLDFKDPDAVAPCLRTLEAAVAQAGAAWRHPIWLNADVFTGPGGGPTKFNASVFLQQCQAATLSNVALSLGWTTGVCDMCMCMYTRMYVCI